MEQIRRVAVDQHEVEAAPVIPTPRRPVIDDEVDSDACPPDEPDGKPVPAGGLSERDLAILTFEKQWWRQAGIKEQAIRDRFDLSSTRYYQILNGLLDDPAALRHDPILVGRLRRLRGSRARLRRNPPL